MAKKSNEENVIWIGRDGKVDASWGLSANEWAQAEAEADREKAVVRQWAEQNVSTLIDMIVNGAHLHFSPEDIAEMERQLERSKEALQ